MKGQNWQDLGLLKNIEVREGWMKIVKSSEYDDRNT